jgi:nicotinamidase-related amidase
MRDAVPTIADHLRQRGVETVILTGADTHAIMRPEAL